MLCSPLHACYVTSWISVSPCTCSFLPTKQSPCWGPAAAVARLDPAESWRQDRGQWWREEKVEEKRVEEWLRQMMKAKQNKGWLIADKADL